jgi:undecaprenyl phosphate N,N'-diacetylbacillosamine 1-phosphate transferase
MYVRILKPLFDRLVALAILLPASPFLALTALLIYFKMGPTVLFTQPRPGQNGKIFNIYKFRTMTDERDEQGELLSDEERLKGIGKTIRALSIDELPQLFNVLKGDMSIIGPRPLLVEYLPLYSEEQRRRHNVKPGITGWAQVNGRNAIGWKEKFALDCYYVDHISFLLDLKILLMTIKKVFMREDISASGHVTMEKFNGSN